MKNYMIRYSGGETTDTDRYTFIVAKNLTGAKRRATRMRPLKSQVCRSKPLMASFLRQKTDHDGRIPHSHRSGHSPTLLMDLMRNETTVQSIHDVIHMIPEDSLDEALNGIETITLFPAKNIARLRVCPVNEFRLIVSLTHNGIRIDAENRAPVMCREADFLASLKHVIYTIDEAISQGTYRQTPPQANVIRMDHQPPVDMDLPVWDASSDRWWDAEY